ncbi:hypothetical protein PM082_013449 [Marasmius tenuissimus]|nr:hypothetical protein PM082_013449 [Marasmius tenuissimus]
MNTELNSYSPDDLQNRTKKRRKQAEKEGSGLVIPPGRGKLRAMTEMPLDVVFEIFALLEAPDLMRLSRLNQSLYNLLMSKSIRQLWTRVLSRDPDFPWAEFPRLGMTEPNFVNLAFSEHCHHCLREGDFPVFWIFKTRLCPTCLGPRFTNVPPPLVYTSYPLLLSERYSYATNGRPSSCSVYELQDIAEVQSNAGFPSNEYHARKQEHVNTENHHANIWRSYKERSAQRQEADYEHARKARSNQIARRLCELGYADEVAHLTHANPEAIADRRAIKSLGVVLPEKVWKSILPSLIPLLEETRESLKRKRRKEALKRRPHLIASIVQEHNGKFPNRISPSPADICWTPKVKAMIEHEDPNAYSTPELFADLADELPVLCEEWRTSKRYELLSLLPPGSNLSRLSLAKTFFKCSDCTTEPVSYPRIFFHECLRSLRFGYRNRGSDVARLLKTLEAEPWNVDGDRVRYYQEAEQVATAIIRTCGLHPDVATPEDVDQLAPWLECPLCRSERGRAVFPWRKAILHGLFHLRQERKLVNWRCLQPHDIRRAKNIEARSWESCTSNREDWVCKRCLQGTDGGTGRMSWSALFPHLQFSHQIPREAIREWEDYDLHADASMDQPPFHVVIPPADPGAEVPEVIDLLDDDSDDEVVEVERPPPPTLTIDEDGLEYIEISD